MKTKTLLLVALVVVAFSITSYKIGYHRAETLSNKNEIEKRYFEVIGNPSTQQEQCTFDYVIYADSTECK